MCLWSLHKEEMMDILSVGTDVWLKTKSHQAVWRGQLFFFFYFLHTPTSRTLQQVDACWDKGLSLSACLHPTEFFFFFSAGLSVWRALKLNAACCRNDNKTSCLSSQRRTGLRELLWAQVSPSFSILMGGESEGWTVSEYSNIKIVLYIRVECNSSSSGAVRDFYWVHV